MLHDSLQELLVAAQQGDAKACFELANHLRLGNIHEDFAEVESVLRLGGVTLIGTAEGSGEEAVMDALRKALACPSLEWPVASTATRVMVSITADWEVTECSAVESAMNYLHYHYIGRPDISVGTLDGECMADRVMVTVLVSSVDCYEEKSIEEVHESEDLGGEMHSPLITTHLPTRHVWLFPYPWKN